MRLFDRIFGRPNPRDVFRMPDNPSDFIAQLSHRKFWRDMDAQLLYDIGQNTDGVMELLRNFVFVSEHYGLVANSFVKLAQSPESLYGSPLSSFALTLRHLGSSLCSQIEFIRDPNQQKFTCISADMAFTSAILCDPLELNAYAGMAFLYGDIRLNKAVSLEWCQKYKDSEDALLAMPDEKLTPYQKSAKKMIENPTEKQGVMREIAKHAPHLIEGACPTDERTMRELIDHLEQRLHGDRMSLK